MPKYLRNDNCFSEDKEFFPILSELTTEEWLNSPMAETQADADASSH
jgi:hypothetical protein